MAWLVLIVSGVLEAVWAVALGRTEGFTRLAPSVVFLVALAASMGGLACAMRTLPVGTVEAAAGHAANPRVPGRTVGGQPHVSLHDR